ncbi:hypothetical protein D3C81_1463850 [compost metagenome]
MAAAVTLAAAMAVMEPQGMAAWGAATLTMVVLPATRAKAMHVATIMLTTMPQTQPGTLAEMMRMQPGTLPRLMQMQPGMRQELTQMRPETPPGLMRMPLGTLQKRLA